MSADKMADALASYQETLNSKARSTASAYRSALRRFASFLRSRGSNPEDIDLLEIDVNWILDFMHTQKDSRPRTRQVIMAALKGFYRFLDERFGINLDLDALSSYSSKMHREIRQEKPRGAVDFEISRVVEAALVKDKSASTMSKRRRILRDKAIILTLAGCDLHVQELCELNKGDVDYRRNLVRTKQAEKRISQRAVDSIKEYETTCADLYLTIRRKEKSVPLFLRHDRKAGPGAWRLTTQSIRSIVDEYAVLALGTDGRGRVTAGEFRDYFINSASLMRSLDLLHKEIVPLCAQLFEMQKYDEAIFAAMRTVEETLRRKAHLSAGDLGKELAKKALDPVDPILKISDHRGEQESAMFLFWGAFGVLKNPRSHRSLNTRDPITAYECLAFASLLLRMLDDAR